MQCAKLWDWKLILYLECKTDKLDPMWQLTLWQEYISTMHYGFLTYKTESVKF